MTFAHFIPLQFIRRAAWVERRPDNSRALWVERINGGFQLAVGRLRLVFDRGDYHRGASAAC